MTNQVRFQRIGQMAGSAYPANPLTGIRQLAEPPAGPHRDFLAARGWPFAGDAMAAYRTTRLSQTYFALLDAGILDALDWLFISNGSSVAGSLKNWITGRPDAGGGESALVMSGGAIVTDGVASYISYDVAHPSRTRFQERSASVFAYATATPSAAAATNPLIGGIEQDCVRLHRNSGSPWGQAKLNSSEVLTMSPAFSAAMWQPGLWGIGRSGDAVTLLRDGVSISSGVAASAVLPGRVAVGRRGLDGAATYAAQSVSAFGGGRSLTAAEWSDLNTILAAHAAEMKALA